MAAAGYDIHHLRSFFDSVKSISSDPTFENIQGIVEENEILRSQMKNREIVLEEIRIIADLDAELSDEKTKVQKTSDKLNSALAKIEELNEIVTAKSHDISRLKGLAERKDKDILSLQGEFKALEGKRVSLERELNNKSRQIDTVEGEKKKLSEDLKREKDQRDSSEKRVNYLEQFSWELKDVPRQEIGNVLKEIQSDIYGLARGYFSMNLSDEVLRDESKWISIKGYCDLPLPASNSIEAKQMRILACIHRLSTEVSKLICSPVCCAEEGDGLSDMLLEAATNDPERERHVRSVLLALDPQKQMGFAQERAKLLNDDMMKTFGGLLDEKSRNSFGSCVKGICDKGLKLWTKTRVNKETTAWFDRDDFDADHWEVVSGDLLFLGDPKTKKAQVNGNGKPKVNGMADMIIPKDSQAMWPLFKLVGDKGSQLLKRGVVVTRSQTQAAAVELDEEKQNGPRRNQRRDHRAMSDNVNRRCSLGTAQSILPTGLKKQG